MANVKVVSEIATFDVKYTNLSGKGEPRKVNGKFILMKDGRADVMRQNSMGEPLGFFNTIDGNAVITNGRGYYTFNEDALGVKTPKDRADVINEFYQAEDGELIPCKKYQKTEVFEIKKFEPLSAYTDKYIIDNYYSLEPSRGKGKSDQARAMQVKVNTAGMKKLYDYLLDNKVVGRGELNLTSGGNLNTIAYVRAVPVTDVGDWTLEFGTFRQQKRYLWIGSAIVDNTPIEQEEQNVATIEEI